ncbi:hypothetical protein E2320_019091 [Naja naja]|nr:hypothetical protein E2320_019091 [Naja naja]
MVFVISTGDDLCTSTAGCATVEAAGSKVRELQCKLVKEISVSPKDKKALIQNEEVFIKTEFEKLCNALETRKICLKTLKHRKKEK